MKSLSVLAKKFIQSLRYFSVPLFALITVFFYASVLVYGDSGGSWDAGYRVDTGDIQLVEIGDAGGTAMGGLTKMVENNSGDDIFVPTKKTVEWDTFTVNKPSGVNITEPCSPLTCSGAGYECGVHSDGCEGSLDCGICDDGNPCTDDSCASGACSYVNNDSNSCFSCSTGICQCSGGACVDASASGIWIEQLTGTCISCGSPAISAYNCSGCNDGPLGIAGNSCPTLEACSIGYTNNPSLCAYGQPVGSYVYQCCASNINNQCNYDYCNYGVVQCDGSCGAPLTLKPTSITCSGKECGLDGCGRTCPVTCASAYWSDWYGYDCWGNQKMERRDYYERSGCSGNSCTYSITNSETRYGDYCYGDICQNGVCVPTGG